MGTAHIRPEHQCSRGSLLLLGRATLPASMWAVLLLTAISDSAEDTRERSAWVRAERAVACLAGSDGGGSL